MRMSNNGKSQNAHPDGHLALFRSHFRTILICLGNLQCKLTPVVEKRTLTSKRKKMEKKTTTCCKRLEFIFFGLQTLWKNYFA